uniref:Sensory neuron membrane protein 1 n=1 Tax=Culicoides sonorensis TaxID=179676 RepID=A0A336LTW5_CULSO
MCNHAMKNIKYTTLATFDLVLYYCSLLSDLIISVNMKLSTQFFLNRFELKRLVKISCAFITLGFLVSLILVPQLINCIVKYLTILKPGRFIRTKHEKPLPFQYKLFIWNITNPDEINKNIAKPKLQEIGPYVFTQYKQNINIEDNEKEDSYTFDMTNVYKFRPDLSFPYNGDEKLTILNLVLVSGIVKIQNEKPHLLDVVMKGMDFVFNNPTSIFLSTTADEFIHQGIFINCSQTEFSAKALCAEFRVARTLKLIEDDKFRLRYKWFDKLNNSIQARYTLNRGAKNVNDIGKIIRVNNEPTQKIYKQYELCNVINGTDKTFFHPFQKKQETIWVYSHDACISFPLVFSEMAVLRGARTAYRNLYLSDPLMNADCNCNPYNNCSVPKGTIDMHSCLDIFVLGSLPHFYLAENNVRESLEGMKPTKKLHQTGIYFDLITGVPIRSLERFQVNFRLNKVKEYPIMSNLPDHIWIPAFWYEESFTPLKPDLALMILSQGSSFFGTLSGYVLISIGVLGLVIAVIKKKNQTKNIPIENGIRTIQENYTSDSA